MIAALGTLAFLATLWLLVVVGAAVLGQSGKKIVAALSGKTVHSSLYVAPVRLRTRRLQKSLRASAQWRAAA